MSKFWKRERDSVERVLREGRPEARDELVRGLTSRAMASRPARRWSRVSFAGAMTVFMVGFFASFGGLGYAAASAHSAANTITHIVTPSKAQVSARTTQSAAQDQYGHQKFTPPVAKPKTPQTQVIKVAGISTSQPQASSNELPFTGLGLGVTTALGVMLLALGALLRRRESHAKR